MTRANGSWTALSWSALSWSALALLAACSRPEERTPASPRASRSASPASAVPEPVAWTPAFPRKSVLIAARIEIVGPRNLIEHLAIAQDPTHHAHAESATPEGMRIEESRLPESDEPIAAQLDNLTLRAMDSLVVLFSPNAREVTLEAAGDVYFHGLETGEEKRADTLRLVGTR